MKTVNEQKHDHARSLFFQTDKSQGEIAAEVGISDKTLYLWTKEGDWRRLRSASNLMPSLIIDNFYAQVQELNNEIRGREPGKRYPSLQEAEVFRKMMLTIDRSKKRATQPQYMEMFQTFISWIQPQSHDHTKLFTTYADGFLKSRSTAGFHPYDIEYEEPEPQDTPLASLRGTKQSRYNTEEAEEYYTEPIEETANESSPPYFQGGVPAEPSAAQAGGGGSSLAQDDQTDSHNTSLSFGEGRGEATLTPDQSELFSRLPLKDKNDKPEIIGNSENPQQQNDPQQLTPKTPQKKPPNRQL